MPGLGVVNKMLELLRVPLPIVVGEAIGIPLLTSISLSLAVEFGIGVSVLRIDPRLGVVILGRPDVGLLVVFEANLDLDWAWVIAGLKMAAIASKNIILDILDQIFDIDFITYLANVNTESRVRGDRWR